jgi:uncharacterized protein
MEMDSAMNENYKYMLNSNIGDGARRDLKRTQKQWLYKRNNCRINTCIIDLYKSRLSEICDYPVITGVHPVCKDHDDILKTFTNQPNGV